MGCSTRRTRRACAAGLPMAASAETAQTAGGSGCAQCYTVNSGDTLSKIARKFGTTVNNLVALNGIANPDQIAAGTTICVKAKGSQPAGKYYTVKQGDTLYSIARKYGWTASYLAQVTRSPTRMRSTPAGCCGFPPIERDTKKTPGALALQGSFVVRCR